MYTVVVDALGDLPEGAAGRGGLHVVDDVPVESGLMISDIECRGFLSNESNQYQTTATLMRKATRRKRLKKAEALAAE